MNNQNSIKIEKFIRYSLATILLFVAINAFGGGIYGMLGAKSVPVEWLNGSPFNSYFIPSIVLFVVVGGFCLLTSILMFIQYHSALKCSILAATLLIIWIAAQLLMIGYVSWLQPVIAIVGCLILILSKLLFHSSKNREYINKLNK